MFYCISTYSIYVHVEKKYVIHLVGKWKILNLVWECLLILWRRYVLSILNNPNKNQRLVMINNECFFHGRYNAIFCYLVENYVLLLCAYNYLQLLVYSLPSLREKTVVKRLKSKQIILTFFLNFRDVSKQ